MRKKLWVNIAMMLFFILMAYAPGRLSTAAESQPGSAAVYPEKIFDFGLVLEGKEVTHDFVIQNRGVAELLVLNVKPG